jgi:hypothetical protein
MELQAEPPGQRAFLIIVQKKRHIKRHIRAGFNAVNKDKDMKREFPFSVFKRAGQAVLCSAV